MITRLNSLAGKRVAGPDRVDGVPPEDAGLRIAADWLPLLLLPVALLTARHTVPPWGVMGLMAIALYGGFKWLVYRLDCRRCPGLPAAVRWWFLFGWVGMSLLEFAATPATRTRPAGTGSGWIAPLWKLVLGALLVWGIARWVPAEPGWVRGWLGMVGCILMLHFGALHLLALCLQALGYRARPLMDRPLCAAGVAEFWGARWNTAFHGLAERFVFRPLIRRWGATNALITTFLVSGVVHELAITVPARGGYGLPTLYFAIQAAGVLAERRLGMHRHPVTGRLLAWLVVAGPVGFLFPPPFVVNVALPLLETLGAF